MNDDEGPHPGRAAVDTDQVIQLVYSSHATAPFSPDALRALLIRARANNTVLGVSGMLLHVDGAFLQVLEGTDDSVHKLFVHIGEDRRHHRVLLLLQREISERNFGDWSMGFFDASGAGASLPGYRSNTGFADLMGDPSTVLRVVSDFRTGRWRSLAV
jgi:hypothetical protein